ncbi:MAG: hypothetical protein BGO89_10145 [Candidatus Kapaibacterium thiocyanatum]|uniref:Uncharacterized protein n=1 Tax=Candidatus Kapaibacterium thiocyanatum TaxID=1895771 RepID=A0A1M3KWU4_9BACT|nr:MAG: hypothetical protein BGO89_10145 ['Candidatus Kapabacteria' thiocyanatum]
MVWKDFEGEDYHAAGTTRIDGGTVVLTETQPYSDGAVWSRKQVEGMGGFATTFTFRMTNGNDNELPDGSLPGADGIVFVVQNSGPTALGKSGEGIGYEGMPKTLAVEFDTYLNPARRDVSSARHWSSIVSISQVCWDSVRPARPGWALRPRRASPSNVMNCCHGA